MLAALAWLAAGPVIAGADGPATTVLDPVLRHIGNGLYRDQCGFEELTRIGLWGDRYAISFRTARAARLRVEVQRVWGVAAPSTVAVLVDGREIGRLTANQDPKDHPLCGTAWTSEPVALEPGQHTLTIAAGRGRGDIDDVAFQGVALRAEQAAIVFGYGKGRVYSQDQVAGPPGLRGWVEAVMDTTTLVATFGLLAFLLERLTNGLSIVLSYWKWWQLRMEVPATADPDTRARIERNRRVGLFGLSALLAIIGAVAMKLSVLAHLGLGSAQSTAGQIVTGLLLASGADPIREAFKFRERGGEASPPPKPIQVTGTLVLQQPVPAGLTRGEAETISGSLVSDASRRMT